MDLKEFTSGTTVTKPWLTIVAKSITVDTVTANNVVSPPTTAFVSMVNFNTLAGPQAGANLFVGLSPNSRLIIPANSMVLGDVYRLEFNATVTTPNPGDIATFDFACGSGPITSFPVQAPAAFVDVPILGVCDITLATPTTINVQTTIGGFFGGPPPMLDGYSFGQPGVAFDSGVDQSLTFGYTTATFTSTQITRLLVRQLASGA
jgi:hypothetical protein